MHFDLKSVTSLLLAILFLINQLSIIVFSIDVNSHKNFVHSSPSKTADKFAKFNLEEIRISKNFKWLKINKEFLLNGEMYDVKKILLDKNNTILLCKHDTKEKNLLSSLKRKLDSMSMSSSKSNGAKPLAISLKLQDIIFNRFTFALFISCFNLKQNFTEFTFSKGIITQIPETPPPIS